jgi:hypothetical protein
MNNLIPSNQALTMRRVRGVGRELTTIDAQTEVAIAHVDSTSDVEAAKVDAVGSVGKRAMWIVADVSQVEQQLSQLVPLAVSRLQAIGDVTAITAAEIVADLSGKLRRSR